MTKYFHLYTSPIETNTYIVINGDRGFVVDPGGEADEILKIFAKNKAELDAILITHAHFDHIGAVARLARESENALILMHKDDLDKVGSYKNMGFASGVKVEKFSPHILLVGKEKLNIAGLDVSVIHTPGHSKGSVCYIVEDKIFVGDTLFFSTYGRTDFYDGSLAEIKNSIINKLFRLKGNYTLLPGHGEPTTLAYERVNNEILNAEQTPNIVD